MNTKEKLKNDIIVKMSNHISKDDLTILDTVLTQCFFSLDIQEAETSLSTLDNTNEYIINMYMIKKATKLSEQSVEAYMRTLKELITAVPKPLISMEQTDIEYYLYLKQQNNVEGTTLNNYIRNISAFYTWMRKSKLINENPCDGIDLYPVKQKPIQHLNVVEMEMIRNACTTKRQRAIVEFLRCTALRRGEVPGICIKDVDFNTGKIMVYGQKTRKYRTVMLDDMALKYLKIYLDSRNNPDPDEQLFALKVGRKLKARDVYDTIHYLAEKTQLKKLHPHVFRSTCATNICKRGGSEEMAGIYLGHTPRTVTGKHYTYRSEQFTEDIFNKYVKAV